MMGHRTKSSRFMLLSGDWQFYYSPDAKHLPIGFERPDYDASQWKTIKVPADWQAEGYGEVSSDIPAYRAAGEARIAGGKTPVGSYRRAIELTDAWNGADITLEIAGAGSAYAVWVNGQRIGYVQDGKLPSEFDVTRLVHPGRNIVAIQVYRWSVGSFLENSDARNASGLDREVILVAAPRMRIRDFFVHAGLDRSTQGKLAVDLSITPGAAATASFTLLDADAHEVLSRTMHLDASDRQRDVTLRGTMPNVRPWSAKVPYLYKILVELRDTNGLLLQSTYARVGFRTIVARGGQLFVNGQPIVLRGTARREMDDASLHAIAGPAMERYLQRLKLNGINAIRTGYPNDAHFYELTDKYGFYVLDEPNMDGREIRRWQLGATRPHDGHAWREAELGRVMNMVARDKNHPSIIAWSMGRDRRGDANAAFAAAAVARRDPDRLIVCCRNRLERAWASRWNTPLAVGASSAAPVTIAPPGKETALAPKRKDKQ